MKILGIGTDIVNIKKIKKILNKKKNAFIHKLFSKTREARRGVSKAIQEKMYD